MKSNRIFTASLLCAALFASACGQKEQKQTACLLDADQFDTTVNNVKIGLYTIANGDITLQATNFGGRVASIFTPDKDGNLTDIVVGRSSIREYADPQGERFLGACVGPVANRIGGAGFTLDGVDYSLPKNDNDVNTLHGGFYGFDMVPWDVQEVTDTSVTLHLLRPDGFEGYPGNLDVVMEYSLTKDNEFVINYSATTDKATPVNISNHPFFNLRGEGEGTVEDYVMQINASAYTPIDSLSIPLGGNESVEGTPFDFRSAHKIGDMIGDDNEQLRNAKGYDHNWVLDRKSEGTLETACTVWCEENGRFLEVLTDQPGLQFYSGNFFDGTGIGKNGKPLAFRSSLALETQHFPDTPNRPDFPSITLRPGETYTQICVYRFSVKE